jgi:inner membrane protein involved in colicin E2 resistance
VLAVGCWIATAVLTFIAYAIYIGASVEDRRIGTLLFALAALTGGLTMFCDQPEVALVLQALVAFELIGLATVLIRARRR